MFGFRSDKSKANAQNELPANAEKNRLAAVSVGFLGKLPSHADFLSQNLASREAQELDDCLKQWVTDLDQKESQSNQDRRLNSVGFALVGGHGRQTIVGAIYDSTDRLGRRYPFSYFVRLTLTDLYFRPALAWFAAEQVLSNKSIEVADSSLSQSQRLLDLSQLPVALPNSEQLDWLKDLEKIDTTPSVKQLKSASMESMVTTSFTSWIESILGNDIRCKTTALAMLHAKVDRYINQGANGELTLPLGPASSAKLSLLFWFQLLSLLLAGKEWRPDFIWSMHETNSHLYILDRPLTPSRLNKAFLGEQCTDTPVFNHCVDQNWAEKMLSNNALLLLDAVIAWGHGK
ncbi:type VI secretion system-associated protein TagF [Marinomonas balearica]|uniref:Type VI secretion system protein ImpM n=1 Tax=Marinomonas balearica TaxID=491947 RepID=A0A4R6M3G1_9GAMM|nr:type VI secretion system-associated protein TagF [Marinomonas balearica]TDO95536.1 type VI secretion system protein ImpM [Marinomonas balearica]